jgi:hypothetical protein
MKNMVSTYTYDVLKDQSCTFDKFSKGKNNNLP